jgi:hypothetical protein
MWKKWKRVYILTLKIGILYLNMITDSSMRIRRDNTITYGTETKFCVHVYYMAKLFSA